MSMSVTSEPIGISAAQFARRARRSNVLSTSQLDTLEDLLRLAGQNEDGQILADKLVSLGLLTRYQAETLARDEPAALVLNDYVVLEPIGEGGMGRVFKANHRRLGRTVALKVLRAELTRDEAAIRRFEREVQVAGQLSHRHVVMAHDAGEAQGVHYLITEFVEGRDLQRLVREDGPLPVSAAVLRAPGGRGAGVRPCHGDRPSGRQTLEPARG